MFVTHFDSAGYVLVLLSFLVLILNANRFKSLQFRKPLIFWLLWCIYAFLNYNMRRISVNPMSMLDLYRNIFVPLIVMTVVVIEYKNNPIRLLWLCFITHAVYMLMGYYFDRGILYRIDDEENQLGNAYAIISSFTLFYLILLNRTRKINTVLFGLLTVVIMLALAMSGTRKAFSSGVIFLVFWLLSLLRLKKVWSWILVALFLWLGFRGYNQLMENTFMGQRMEYYALQQEEYLPPGAPEFLRIFGDRAGHYYYGWINFLEHPLFGVGTGQARVEQGFNTLVYTHSEYMAQLNDQGIVGFLLFVFFNSWIVFHLIKQVRYNRQIGLCMLGGIMALLFLGLSTWTWAFPRYFICLGVLIGYCNSSSEQNVLQSPFRS